MFLGSWFGQQLDVESTITIGAAVTAMDIISFTGIGKRTVNAKAMANKSVAARLFVYGIEKNDVLIPTCGFGDYLYYAIWISGIHAVSDSMQTYIFYSIYDFDGNYHTVCCCKEAFSKRQL